MKKKKIKIKRKNLYERLIELDNVKEDYSLSYLKFLFKEMKEDFEKIILKINIGISDNNLNLFGITDRKNSKTKILEYINFLKNTKLSIPKERKNFYNLFLKLLNKENNLTFESKMEITWENEELYLYNLYIFLLDSTKNKMIEYSNSNNSKLDNFINSQFYEEYLKNLVIFLKVIDKNFHTRFKNFEFKEMDDKTLFEDYIQFLGTYDFTTDLQTVMSFWNETFVSLTQEEKTKIVSNINYFNIYKTISYNPLSFEIKIEEDGAIKKEIIIKDVDKYAFNPLVKSLDQISTDFDIDWIKLKFLKPTNYKRNLFVCLKKNIWGKLLIDILNSDVYKEVLNKLYDYNQINFFV